MELKGPRVHLRPLNEHDIPRLVEILGEPEVARWWGDYDLARARQEFLAEDCHAFTIELEGDVVGSIQYWEEPDPYYRHAGIDIFIAARHQRKALGPEAIATLARHLFDERGHHRLVIDPAADNSHAISAYRKAGFQPVGIMRRYELDRGGTWRDGLLMDLLKEDFGVQQGQSEN